LDDERAAAKWTLAVDAVTAEVTAALAEAGVASVLLKGPVIASWLYDDPAARPYADTDLLVDPSRAEAAGAVLRTLRFRPPPDPGTGPVPAREWRRGAFTVDVHETLPGATADWRTTWAVLSADTARRPVAGVEVAVLAEPARLAHLALHAAQHGPYLPLPLEDLRRGVERVPDTRWRSAADVAERIGAEAAFAGGLSLLPEGRRLLERIGLEVRDYAEWLLGVPLVGGFARLADAPGIRAKAALLVAELVPPAEYMRSWTPIARRSRRGLAAAYLWRWLYLLLAAPPALGAWRRARRGSENASD
jgi:putative nucleotidyltransferase-like protein